MDTKLKSGKSDGFIDLGKKPRGIAAIAVSPDDKGEGEGDTEVHYPRLYVCSGNKLELGGVGATGEAMIKYVVEEAGERASGDEAKEYRYELKIEGIKTTGKSEVVDKSEDESTEPKSVDGFKEAFTAGVKK